MASSGSVNFGGLASGLDTAKIIEDLLKVDSKPVTRLQTKQEEVTEKSSIFATVKTNLLAVQDALTDLRSTSTLAAFSASSSDEEALTLSAGSTAAAGNYSLKVLSLAQAETVSGNAYTDSTTALGIAGEMVFNGHAVSVRSSDSLAQIKEAINDLDAGVTASVLKVSANDYRLMVAASDKGAEGFVMANAGEARLLDTLGLTDGATSINLTDSGAVVSDTFTSTESTIASQLGVKSAMKGTVTLQGRSIEVDLAADSLTSLRDKINAISGNKVTAAIETVTEGDETSYRLTLTGVTTATDTRGILESLGILSGGTSAAKTTFETAAIAAGKDIGVNTKLSDLGAATQKGNETITVSGTDANGGQVSRVVTVDKNTTVADLLDEIEQAFGGTVKAILVDGRIRIESTTGGTNELSVNIVANDERDGTLDFGAVVRTDKGRERLVVEGSDAHIRINNVDVYRTTNEVSDVLTGVTLNLKEADETANISIKITQDTDSVVEKVKKVVDAYNTFLKHVNENSTYDTEKKTGGPLVGDMTVRTMQLRMQSILQGSYKAGVTSYNHLAQLGIEQQADGQLKLNTATLKDALDDDPQAVASFFTVSRTASDNDVTFVYNSSKTRAGSYEVAITRAAEKATVVSTGEGEATASGTLNLTDARDNQLAIDYTEGMSAADIAASINANATKTAAEVKTSSGTLTRTDGAALTLSTAISDLSGVTIKNKDTITITATNHQGRQTQRNITLTEGSTTTIGDLLNSIETQFNGAVDLSIDDQGHLVAQDTTSGSSQMNLSITTTVAGLSFGTFATTQKGRDAVPVAATVTEDGRLSISQTGYGSTRTFTTSGGSGIGIADGTYAGVDMAGTINGVAGTGSGIELTAATTDEATRGIVIASSITPEDLASDGASQGTILLSAGLADSLYNEISSMTDTVNGFLQTRIDSLKVENEFLSDRIEEGNNRIEQRRAAYTRRFAELERALSQLQSLQQRLSASLANL